MGKIRLLAVLLACFLLFLAACREEKYFRAEKHGERLVISVKTGDSADFSVKFEFNDGKNLSGIYWRRNALFGYFYDFRSDKLFIDAPSGIFFKSPADFYENLERDLDIQKIKNSLTPEILREFRQAIAASAVFLPNNFGPGFSADLRRAKEKIGRIDLEAWYRAVEAEKNKIHALGLEYCVNKEQAEKLLSKIDFNLTYRKIVGERIKNKKQFVACLGENHPEDADRIEAIRILEELKVLDFKYLLLECVLAADQKILDDYKEGCPGKRTALAEYLRENNWDGQSVNLGGRGVLGYLEIIDAAKSLGYKIIGIGNHQRDKIESLRNNYWMALNVVEILKKDPDAKIIVFAGATHVFPNYISDSEVVLEGYVMRQDIPNIVKKLTGVETIVFECVGGLKDVEFRKYLDPEKVLEKHIENRGLGGKRFFIPVLPEISTLSPEANYYFIHSPQY